MDYGLGVDLGTTYTVAAIRVNGRVEVAPLGGDRPEIPSAVYVPPTGEPIVGTAAEWRGAADPARLARDIKGRMGGPAPILLGGVPYPAPVLLARLLGEVVAAVARQRQAAPSAVTVTHQAGWPDKRDLLGQAVRLAQLGNARLVSEPEAAALRFADRDRIRLGDVVAVYDLGGGTFDAAVLRRTDTGFVMLGHEGIAPLGGVTFDDVVYRYVLNALAGPVRGLNPASPEVAAGLHRLRQECVAAKEALSGTTEVLVPVALPGLHARVPLKRDQFEAMVRPALAATLAALSRVLYSAEVTAPELRSILLVGGSSRIPLIRQLLTAEFGRPVLVDAHPEHSIALGAALLTGPTAGAALDVPPIPVIPSPPRRAARAPRSARAAQPARPPAGRPGRRLRWLAGVAVVMALALAATAAFVWYRGGERVVANAGWATPQPSLMWSFDIGRALAGRPAVDGDRVYFGGQDGVVYALDRHTGDVRWRYDTGRPVVSSAQVVDGVVYTASQDGFVYAIGAESGDLRWKAAAGVDINSSPTIADGALYIGSNDNGLYSFTLTGKQRWRFAARGIIWGTPAVSANLVYVGSQDGNMYAVEAATGTQRWATRVGEVFSSPVVVDDALFVGSNDGRLHRLDPGTGQPSWAFPTDDKVSSTPLVVDGVAYFANFAGVVYAADARTGGERWRFPVDGGKPIFSSPALADGVLYVGSHAGRLYAIDATTGVKRWEYLTRGIVGSSPRVVDGVLYVGSDDGRMYALRLPRSSARPPSR